MRNSKLGLRALGLAVLAALSLTAFFAASAQAQEHLASTATNSPGNFEIELSTALASNVPIGGEQEGKHGLLLVKGRNLRILCETGKVLPTSKIISSTEALAEVLFEKCLAFNFEGTQHLPCLVLSAGEKEDSVLAKTIALPILHGGKLFVLFEPHPGVLNFVEVELHGATCPLPLVNPVKGAVVAEVDLNKTAKPLLLFSELIQLLVADKLTFGGFPAYLDADALVELLGVTHGGRPFGVL